MNSFLIVNDEDMNFVWDTIQEQQVILHPTIAPDGRFDFKKFFEIFKKNDYDGIYNFELSSKEYIEKSIEYLKRLKLI